MKKELNYNDFISYIQSNYPKEYKFTNEESNKIINKFNNKTITNKINQSTTNTILTELKTLITNTISKLILLILLIFLINSATTTTLNIIQYDGYINHATILECITTDIDENCLETPKIILENIINPI